MIDNFALGLTHLLLAVGLWRVLLRDDLDRDPDDPVERPRIVQRFRRVPPKAQDARKD